MKSDGNLYLKVYALDVVDRMNYPNINPIFIRRSSSKSFHHSLPLYFLVLLLYFCPCDSSTITMQGNSRNRSGLFAFTGVGKNLAYTSNRDMSLKRSLQEDTTGGEKADEKAAKRAKVDEKEETKNENNSDEDNVKSTAKVTPKPPVASAFGGIFSSGPTSFGKGGFGSIKHFDLHLFVILDDCNRFSLAIFSCFLQHLFESI